MSNQDFILDIVNLIRKNYKLEEHKAILLLAADVETESVLTECQGNMKVLASAFGNQMRERPEFNQLIKALMGAYLSQHPEEKKEFIKGLEIVGFNPNMN